MIRAKKRYGQNFLTDHNILEKIITHVDIKPDEDILEIGTGHGALTRELDKLGRSIISYEIDRDLFKSNQLRLMPNLKSTMLLEADFLQADFPPNPNNAKYKVIANIPYNITTPIIEKLINNKEKVSSIYLMVQKEVADRLVAVSGTKDYGSFTIFVDYYCEVKKLFNVSNTCFRPVPKVDSAFICITPRPRLLVDVMDEKIFFALMHAAFWGRRKTIYTALRKYPGSTQYSHLVKDALEACDIDLQIRGERLTIQQFATLSNKVKQSLSAT